MTSDGKTEPGIKRLPDGRWRIRAQARDPRTGRKISKMETIDGTKQEARVRLAKLRVELESEGPAPKRLKLGAYAVQWLLSRGPSLKPSVRYKYANNIEAHIVPGLGELYVDAIQPSDVMKFLNGLAATLAPNTRLNMLRLLRTMARDAQAEGKTSIYFCHRVAAPVVEDNNGNVLTAAQLAKLLAVIPLRWRGIIQLMTFTGLRWGEVSALRWEDVDRREGIVHIRRSNWRGHVVVPKTRKSKRPVPILPDVLALLGPPRRGWIFPAPDREPTNGKPRIGELYMGCPLNKVMAKACKVAGVPYTTPHGLRRTFNNLARKVTERQVVKAIMGHTTDAMFEHYSSVDVAERTEAVQRVRDLVTEKAKDLEQNWSN